MRKDIEISREERNEKVIRETRGKVVLRKYNTKVKGETIV